MRGLLREVIALVTWITAVWLAWHYSGLVESHLGGALANEGVRTWVARALIVFLVVILIGTAIGLIVSHFVRLSLFSGLDRACGGRVRAAARPGHGRAVCHASVTPCAWTAEPWWRQLAAGAVCRARSECAAGNGRRA